VTTPQLAEDLQALQQRLQASEAARQTLQQSLAEREAEVATMRRESEEFLRMVSHDLRAPLRHVLAYGTLVREMLAEGEDATAALATLDKSAKQMGQMVDALVELGRLSRAPLAQFTLPAGTIVREAFREIDGSAQGRKITWRIAEDWPEVHGDPAQLRLLWRELLANAVKFTRPRGEAVIEVGWQAPAADAGAEAVAQGPQFFVRDNGVGFNPAQAGQLFAPFHKLHSGNEFEGLGTGLAQVRQVVQRHGGSVRAEGVQGQGCTVWFTLPACTTAARSP
jgi:signal transduction histidine kinase